MNDERRTEEPDAWLSIGDPYEDPTTIFTTSKASMEDLAKAGFRLLPLYRSTDADEVDKARRALADREEFILKVKKLVGSRYAFGTHIDDDVFLRRLQGILDWADALAQKLRAMENATEQMSDKLAGEN